MLDILYQIIIFPIYSVIEALFHYLTGICPDSIVLNIFIISILVNVFCLPLYINAEKLQQEEHQIQQKLKKRVDSIKKNFKGDERHMLLQTYYKQNHYHPVMALRSSASLLLQIPFFTAAYIFFSQLYILNGCSCGLISNLLKPDQLIKFGSFGINFLPILMTIINIVAGVIYAKKLNNKGLVPLITVSLIFLVLLYNSPAGLVLYWTFNNLFSLVKNIMLYCPNKKINIFTYLILSLLALYYLVNSLISMSYAVVIVLLLTNFLYLGKDKISKFLDKLFPNNTYSTFLILSTALAILIGLYIPSCVLASAPLDISGTGIFNNSLPYIFNSFIKALGFFVIWGSILYTFSNKYVKKSLTLIAGILLSGAIINYITISYPQGVLNPNFTFNLWIGVSVLDKMHQVINYVLLAGGIVLLIFLIYKSLIQFKKFICVLMAMVLCWSGYNMYYIARIFYLNNTYLSQYNSINNIEKEINLSKNQNNVLVIMIDRAISSYLPIIMKEIPELKESYAGFTYYPNTVSFGGQTIYSVPSMFGGYEYTPDKWFENYINGNLENFYRDSQFMLPKLFSNLGYNTTVYDIPFSGEEIGLISQKDFENMPFQHKRLNRKYGNYYKNTILKNSFSIEKIVSRNILYYSILKVLPASLRLSFYADGKYLNMGKLSNIFCPQYLIDNYAELFYLSEMTDLTSKKPTYNVIFNDLTHNSFILSKPKYKLNDEYATKVGRQDVIEGEYDVNAAAIIMLGKYLDYLRQNGVYDNTRIIIASDHGWPYSGDEDVQKSLADDIRNHNPLLLVKDFNSNAEFKTDNSFYTLADLPEFIVENLVENPKNPISQKPLITKRPINQMILMMLVNYWGKHQFKNNPKFYIENAKFRTVKEDIFKNNNWSEIMDYNTVMKVEKNRGL